MEKNDRRFQTYELSQADDFITGNRLYKLIRYTRDSSGKIIKVESAEPAKIDWGEVPEGGCCSFVFQFLSMEMEDSLKGKK